MQQGLDAAMKAGMRPPPRPRTTPVRDSAWIVAQLEVTGITMIGRYRGLVTGIEFQCKKGHVFKGSRNRQASSPTRRRAVLRGLEMDTRAESRLESELAVVASHHR